MSFSLQCNTFISYFLGFLSELFLVFFEPLQKCHRDIPRYLATSVNNKAMSCIVNLVNIKRQKVLDGLYSCCR